MLYKKLITDPIATAWMIFHIAWHMSPNIDVQAHGSMEKDKVPQQEAPLE